MAVESGWAEFWRFLGQGVTIVLGWVVVHRLSFARDKDKARREIVAKSAEALSDSIDKLFLKSREYHLGERNSPLEVEIKMALQDASQRASALSSVCDSGYELTSCRSGIIKLKQAITANHFEDEHVAPLNPEAQQLQDIAAEVLKVKQAFLRLKHSLFRFDE